MEIIHSFNSTHKNKPDGTRVDYYLLKEYEVHYNQIPPGTSQEWHSHNQVEEVIFMVSGKLEIQWIDGDEKRVQKVEKGDLIRVGHDLHAFVNKSKRDASFIVLKMMLSGKDNSRIFKEDKQTTR